MNLARQAYRANVLPDTLKHYPENLLLKKPTILAAVKQGNYLGVAAKLAGISHQSLTIWVRRGASAQDRIDAGEEVHPYDIEYAKFYQEYEQAQAESEAVLVARVMAHTETQWVAAMTMLERRFPERWRRRETTEHIVTEGSLDDEEKVDLGSNDRLAEVLSVLTRHGLLPGQSAPGIIEGSAEVVDAEAKPVHPAHADDDTAGRPPTPTP